MNFNNKRGFSVKSGFTLIELLVVIAIIGILTAVILSSLNTARDKGANAAIKSNMNGLRNQSEIIYEENNNVYATVCDDPKVIEALAAAANASGGVTVCSDDDGYWVAQSPLKIADNDGSTFWCIDNTGTPKGGTTAIVAGVDTFCP